MPVPPDVLRKVRKLAQLPDEARQSQFGVAVTRLTVLKSLCLHAEVANRFVTFLAQRIQQKVKEPTKPPRSLSKEDWSRHREMIDQAVTALESYRDRPTEEKRARLRTLFHELVGEQNEHRRIYGGPVRIIRDKDLLLIEYAVQTVIADEASAPAWAYQTARHYAERYDAKHGSGLTPASAPLLQDIADFWLREFDLTMEQIAMPTNASKPKKVKPPKVRFTDRQGQFLAFIHLFRRLHRRGPAELDMVKYFGVTPPSVHSMIVKLEELGLVTREPGVPRSVRVSVPESEIQALDQIKGPAW